MPSTALQELVEIINQSPTDNFTKFFVYLGVLNVALCPPIIPPPTFENALPNHLDVLFNFKPLNKEAQIEPLINALRGSSSYSSMMQGLKLSFGFGQLNDITFLLRHMRALWFSMSEPTDINNRIIYQMLEIEKNKEPISNILNANVNFFERCENEAQFTQKARLGAIGLIIGGTIGLIIGLVTLIVPTIGLLVASGLLTAGLLVAGGYFCYAAYQAEKTLISKQNAIEEPPLPSLERLNTPLGRKISFSLFNARSSQTDDETQQFHRLQLYEFI